MRSPLRLMVCLLLWAPSTGLQAFAAQRERSGVDLAEMSLDELMNVEVELVSRRQQKLADAAAAVFVLSREDIIRSGATALPELLRLVPGLEVASVDASKWAISSRGFLSRFSNKLLVMIDGRTVYSPLFSGVFWDVQDTSLEDIDRIEVIRGPGASLWGANAVNGIINVVTMPAASTKGVYVGLVGGSEDRILGRARYGGAIGERGHYRIHARYLDRDNRPTPSGESGDDAWSLTKGGFRADLDLRAAGSLSLMGELYGGDAGATTTTVDLINAVARQAESSDEMDGGHLLARWERPLGGGAVRLQAYHDRTQRIQTYADHTDGFSETRRTWDIDFQSDVRFGARHALTWGGGYRLTQDDTGASTIALFEPSSRRDNVGSLFVQQDLSLREDRVQITLGTKLERNDYSGWEIQPTVRARWRLRGGSTFWSAVSRAARTPSRHEEDVHFILQPLPGPSAVEAIGGTELESESLLAWEAGWRVRPHPALAVDVAAFYNDYDDLVFALQGAPFLDSAHPIPHFTIPLVFGNGREATALGAEVTTDWQPRSNWRLNLWYSYLNLKLRPKESGPTRQGEDPAHQAMVRSLLDLPHGISLDTILHYVDDLPVQGVASRLRADLRIAWRLGESLELSAGVRDALAARRLEFGTDQLAATTEAPRQYYGRIRWRF